MTKINIFDLPLAAESQRVAGLYDMNYEHALEKDLTSQFKEEMKIRGKSKQNIILSWFGVPRDGKSYSLIYVAEKLAKYWGVELDIDAVAFTPSQALEIVKKIDKGPAIVILDEQMRTHGRGSQVEADVLDTVEKNVGKKRILFLFASPDLKSHQHRYVFEVWRQGGESPFDKTKPLEEQWSHTQVIIYNHKNQKIGYMITGTPKNAKFIQEYERRKDAHIERISKMKGSQRYQIIGKTAAGLLEKEGFVGGFLNASNKRTRETFTRDELEGLSLSTDELKDVVDAVEMKIDTDPKYHDQKMKTKIEKAVQKKITDKTIADEVKRLIKSKK